VNANDENDEAPASAKATAWQAMLNDEKNREPILQKETKITKSFKINSQSFFPSLPSVKKYSRVRAFNDSSKR
jgi:hypothetical protein